MQVQYIFLFSAERLPWTLGQVSWLGGAERVLCGRFTFPGRWPSGRSKRRPHSQWRDRAGFSPDFPVRPVVGTRSEKAVIS